MALLLEKTEKKNEIEYRIRPKVWYGGWLIVLLIFVAGFAYRNQNPYLFLVGFLVLFLWAGIVGISMWPVSWPLYSGSKTITQEKGSWLAHQKVWKIKK